MISAHERQEEGCPEPAAVVAIIESLLRIFAIFWSFSISSFCIG